MKSHTLKLADRTQFKNLAESSTLTRDVRPQTIHLHPSSDVATMPTIDEAAMAISDGPWNDGDDCYELAIVGCGPKATYCLDSLVDQVARHARAGEAIPSIRINMFDPADFPGAGVVYDLRQPKWLRMNFASLLIDAWCRTDNQTGLDAACDAQRPNFVSWLEAVHPNLADPDGFVPRAIVGAYLNWCFQQIVSSLPSQITLNHHQIPVDDVRRQANGWQVSFESGTLRADEVLIATGHGGWRPTHVACSTGEVTNSASIKVIEKVFPVNEQLSQDEIAIGSHVAIRGFALTFIDAALTLTEGRSGKFKQTKNGLRYERSGQEPRRILPFSRSGKPMLAKPDYSKVMLPSRLQSVWLDGANQITNLPKSHGEVDFATDLWPIFLHTADAALNVIGFRDKNSLGVDSMAKRWFQQWTELEVSADRVLRTMKNSCAVATGSSAMNPAWALAESWRQLYGALINRVSHGGLAIESWSAFSSIAKEMERIAFGPPAENLERIVALVESGVVDLGFLDGQIDCDRGRVTLTSETEKCQLDAIVDAIIPSSCHHAPGSVIEKLMDSHCLIQSQTHGGVLVDESAQAISKSGGNVEGLSLVGRAAEGCVLGNDTLSRKLHSYPQMWARRVSKTIVRERFSS